MRRDLITGLLASVLLLAGAQGVRRVADAQRDRWPKTVETPYAPSPAAAPIVSLGYRELATDLLWIRAIGYFGGDDDTADGLRGLVDAMVTLDPSFVRPYEWGARAVDWASGGSTQADRLWALALLERGMARHPDRYKLPFLAGQIYIADLETDDPAQRAAWDLRGAELLEQAIRMPGAPRDSGTLVAHLRTKLGQQDRALRDLKELILTTSDAKARQKLIDKYAELLHADADAIGDEMQWMRERFDAARAAQLPQASESMYVLLGDAPKPYIDLADLATGGRTLIGAEDDEVFVPVGD